MAALLEMEATLTFAIVPVTPSVVHQTFILSYVPAMVETGYQFTKQDSPSSWTHKTLSAIFHCSLVWSCVCSSQQNASGHPMVSAIKSLTCDQPSVFFSLPLDAIKPHVENSRAARLRDLRFVGDCEVHLQKNETMSIIFESLCSFNF